MRYDVTIQSSPLRNFCAIRKVAEIKEREEREEREEKLRKLLNLYNSEEFEENRKEDYANLLKQLPKLIKDYIDDVNGSFFRYNTDKKSSPDIKYKMIMRKKSLEKLYEMLNMKNLKIEKKPPENQVNNLKPTNGLPPRAEYKFRPKAVEPNPTYYNATKVLKKGNINLREFKLQLLAIDKKADEEYIKNLRERYSEIIEIFEEKLNKADQELTQNTIYNEMISTIELANRVLYMEGDTLERKIEGEEIKKELKSGQDKPQNHPILTKVENAGKIDDTILSF